MNAIFDHHFAQRPAVGAKSEAKGSLAFVASFAAVADSGTVFTRLAAVAASNVALRRGPWHETLVDRIAGAAREPAPISGGAHPLDVDDAARRDNHGVLRALALVERDGVDVRFHSKPPPFTSSHVSKSASAARTQPPLPTATRAATSRGTRQCAHRNSAISSVVGVAILIDWKRVWNRSVSRSSCRLLVPMSAFPGGSRSR